MYDDLVLAVVLTCCYGKQRGWRSPTSNLLRAVTYIWSNAAILTVWREGHETFSPLTLSVRLR